jgi:L-malate glycosyltransferase
LKVLYFTRDYATHDHRFLAALAGTGHRIYFLRLENSGKALEDRPIPGEVEQIGWDGGKGRVRWQESIRLVKALKDVIRQVQPDVVHAGPIQGPAFLAALAGIKPLVSMSWGYDLLMDADRSKMWNWATRYTLNRSAVMLGDCEAVRRKAVQLGMPEKKIVMFPWGVDLNHFKPAELPLHQIEKSQKEVFTLLSTRSWELLYGVDLVARAFVQASRRLRDEGKYDLHLVMSGGGSLATELRQIFVQGGAQDRVHFPGQVSWVNLPKFYQAADLYLSASHVDGSSVSLLEAMACGCPVLVSDIPGNREWVQHGVNGWLFKDGEVEGICQHILQAVENRSQLHGMGQAGRRTVESRADWDRNFNRLLDAYQIAVE